MELMIVLKLIFAVCCAAIAASKGRNVIGWFFIGFLLDLIGLIIILVVSNKKEEARVRAHADAERRRLREQLRQERLKTEAFRQHAAQRLDAHDNALGLDTRATPGLAPGARLRRPLAAGPSAGFAPAPPPPPPPPPPSSERVWYYEAEGESRGPVPQSTLVWMLETGAVTRETLVWTDGQGDWQAARNVAAFRDVASS